MSILNDMRTQELGKCFPGDIYNSSDHGFDEFINRLRYAKQTKRAAEYLTFEVITTAGGGSGRTKHEGWGVHLLYGIGGKWAVLPWTYGSCWRCDSRWTSFYTRPDLADSEECYDIFGDLIWICESEDQAREYLYDPESILRVDGYCSKGGFYLSFEHLAFPILRRVFPALIATEIVSVQPMTVAGSLFSMDYNYGPIQSTCDKNIPDATSIRIYSLARELGVSSRSLLDTIRHMGIYELSLVNHLSSLPMAQANQVRRMYLEGYQR